MANDSFQRVHNLRQALGAQSTPFSLALRKACDSLDVVLTTIPDESERTARVDEFLFQLREIVDKEEVRRITESKTQLEE